MKPIKYILAFLSLSLLFISCADENPYYPNNYGQNTVPPVYPPANTIPNIPGTSSTENSYTYSLVANNYTTNYTEQLLFDANDIKISIFCYDYKQGSVKIDVKSYENVVTYSKTLTANLVITERTINSRSPHSLSLSIQNFSGTISFVLTEK